MAGWNRARRGLVEDGETWERQAWDASTVLTFGLSGFVLTVDGRDRLWSLSYDDQVATDWSLVAAAPSSGGVSQAQLDAEAAIRAAADVTNAGAASTAQAAADAAQGAADAAQSGVTALSGLVTTAGTDIDALEAWRAVGEPVIASNTAAASAAQVDATQAIADALAAQGSADTAQSGVIALSGLVTTAQAAADAAQVDATAGIGDAATAQAAADAAQADADTNTAAIAAGPGKNSVTTTAILDGTILGTDLSDGAVTLAKLADLDADRIVGRVTAGSGVPESLTAAQVRTLLGVVAGAGVPVSDADQVLGADRQVTNDGDGYSFDIVLTDDSGADVLSIGAYWNPALPQLSFVANDGAGNVSSMRFSPTNINLIPGVNADIRINGDPGSKHDVIVSQGSGARPIMRRPVLHFGRAKEDGGLIGLSTGGSGARATVETVDFDVSQAIDTGFSYSAGELTIGPEADGLVATFHVQLMGDGTNGRGEVILELEKDTGSGFGLVKRAQGYSMRLAAFPDGGTVLAGWMETLTDGDKYRVRASLYTTGTQASYHVDGCWWSVTAS